jgi:seryl-tRNA synthetase
MNSNNYQNQNNNQIKKTNPPTSTINNNNSNNYDRKQPPRSSQQAIGKIGTVPETRSATRQKEQQIKNESTNASNNPNNQLKRKRDDNVAVKEVKEELPNNKQNTKLSKPIASDDMFMTAATNDFPEQV